MNQQKIVNAGYAACGILIFFVARQFLGFIWDYFRLPVFENLVITVPDVMAAGLGVASFFVLKGNEKANAFSLEVVAELSKVTWPMPKETMLSGVAVIIMVGIASLILTVFDWVWVSLTQKLLIF